MKKLFIGTLLLAAVSVTASAQTTKNTHGKTVSTVAKTTTPGKTHGKTVSAVAKKDKSTVVVYPKKTKVVTTKTHSDNRDKTKVVATKAKGKKD